MISKMAIMSTVVGSAGIAGKIKNIIVEKCGVDENTLTPEACFTSDLGLDSLDVIETFMTLEKEFGIKIPDETAEKLTTVGAVINYITEQTAR